MKRLLAGALLLPLAALAAPYDADTMAAAATLRDRARAENDAYALVASLTREVGPRFAGSPGDREAVQWALRTMKALGFSNVRAEPVEVPQWRRGDIRVHVVGEDLPMVALALGGSAATPAEGVKAPVVMVDSLEALAALPDEAVEGRIVFFNRRMPRRRDGSGYGETVPLRSKGPAEAGARGAVAVVIRSVGTSSERIAHTGVTRYRDDAPRIAAAALSNVDADRLERRLLRGEPVEVSLFVGAQDAEPQMSANVIGEIPGASDDIVLLAAHLDSWDVGPGANDDAAGAAIVLEAARLIREVVGTPPRTLRVVLYADEEFGSSGSSHYARTHADELERHVLSMEADFGAGAVWRLDSNVPEAHRRAVGSMALALAPLGVALGHNAAFGGADIAPLRNAGVPVLGPLQDGRAYFDIHHTVSDRIENIDRTGLQQNVAVYAVAAYLAAAYEPGFGRLPVRLE